MYPMKKLVLAMTATGMLGLSPLYVQAAEANPIHGKHPAQ